jgi:acyl carrier protein
MTNIEKYDQVFMTTFMIEKTALNDKLVYQSIPAWDSVGHMAMIAGLEEAFDIMIDIDDIIDLSSYKKGKEIVAKYDVTI